MLIAFVSIFCSCYQAPTLVCICCSQIKLAFLKWVAISIYSCPNNHVLFIFFLWKNVHESLCSNLISEFIHSFLNSKENRNVHFLAYIEFKRLQINSKKKKMVHIKLDSLLILFHNCFLKWTSVLSSAVIWNANNKVI